MLIFGEAEAELPGEKHLCKMSHPQLCLFLWIKRKEPIENKMIH